MVNCFSKSASVYLCVAICLYNAGCGKKPLFDEIATNRLKVVIKGTYESNSPRDWDIGSTACFQNDDSIFNGTSGACVLTPPSNPSQFMFDIAELRLDNKKFANYRQLITANIDNVDPFFTSGVYLKNDDPGPGTYTNLEVYIRKMLFNSATEFYLDSSTGYEWTVYATAQTTFHEQAVNGFDFNQFQVNAYYDSLLLEASTINRIFPITIPIYGGFNYDTNNGETVLEVRFIIKNFAKKYEYMVPDTTYHLIHYFALSDWLRDVKADETSIGGNVIAVARSYVPGKTVTLNGTAASKTYVIALTNADLSYYKLGSTSKTRPAWYAPETPILFNSNNIESVLDYYLKYEEYRANYNSYVSHVNDGSYENAWINYDAILNNFRIPPLVTWTETGSFTLENVPVGYTYYIYYSAVNPKFTELPLDFPNFVGQKFISEDMAGQPIPIP